MLRDAATPWLSAAEVEERSRIAASRLAGAGVEQGDRVVMSCAPSADLVLAHVGALRLGAIVVPVNTAFGPNELGNVWSEARPKLAVLDDPARLPGVPSVPASLEGLDAAAVCRARRVCRRRSRDADVHLWDDRPAEGSDPQSRQRAGEPRRECTSHGAGLPKIGWC